MRNNRLQKNTTRQIFARRISKGLADIFHIDHLELIRMYSSTKKSDRRDYPVRRRWKSSIVHDPNSSMSISDSVKVMDEITKDTVDGFELVPIDRLTIRARIPIKSSERSINRNPHWQPWKFFITNEINSTWIILEHLNRKCVLSMIGPRV